MSLQLLVFRQREVVFFQQALYFKDLAHLSESHGILLFLFGELRVLILHLSEIFHENIILENVWFGVYDTLEAHFSDGDGQADAAVQQIVAELVSFPNAVKVAEGGRTSYFSLDMQAFGYPVNFPLW